MGFGETAGEPDLIRVLILEDDPRDAELMEAQLSSAELSLEATAVDSEADYIAVLAEEDLNLILSDNKLPGFDGFAALRLARERRPDVPFIFVSGTLGEELAIDAVKAGATDYVLKERLSRLAPAVKRALAEAEERKERQLAEQQLLQTHETMHTLIHSSPEAIMTIDRNRRVGAVWNRAAEELFGWKSEEVFGKEPPFVPEDSLWQYYALVDRVLAGESLTEVEVQRRRRDGTPIDISLSTAPLRDGQGNVTGLVAFIRDVSYKRAAEREIHDSHERLQQLFENAPVMLHVIDMDGCIRDGNRYGELLTGYSREELIGRNLLETGILGEDAVNTHFSILEKSRAGMPVGPLEVKARKKSGEEFLAEVYTRPMRIQGEDLILGTVVDITERRSLEDQLRRAQKMEAVGRLAGGVAHDFNNILTAVSGYVHLCKSLGPGEDTISRYIDSIQGGVDRAARLTQQLLLFSKKAHSEREYFSLDEGVTGLLKMLERLLPDNISISTDLHGRDSLIHGDQAQIEQVLMNLVVNARDAIAGSGQITIRTAVAPVPHASHSGAGTRPASAREIGSERVNGASHTEGGSQADSRATRYVCLSVEDDGSGMDEATRTRLFEPFFTTKGPEKGTGLGLPVVLGIVEQHGGSIDVESMPGRGTRFDIYLPVSTGTGVSEGEEGEEPVNVQSGLRVLLVEDDRDIMEVTSQALSAVGFKVTTAPTVSRALDELSRGDGGFDAVVCDMILSDGTGLEFLERAQPSSTTAVVLTSGYLEDSRDMSTIDARGYRFLEKPYNLSFLARVVQEEIAKKRTSRRRGKKRERQGGAQWHSVS